MESKPLSYIKILLKKNQPWLFLLLADLEIPVQTEVGLQKITFNTFKWIVSENWSGLWQE